MANKEIITGYKAFNHDLTCRDFHYEVSKTYTLEGDIKICEKGFHFCSNFPFDVLNFYPIIDENGNMRRFARVSCPASKAISGDKKTVTSSITIVEELMLHNLVYEQIRQILTITGDDVKVVASRYGAQVATSDYDAQVVVSGDRAKVVATGKNSVIAISGLSGCFKGVNSTFVSCADFGDDGKCIGFVTGCVGMDGLKENTWYTVSNGKFIECEAQP